MVRCGWLESQWMRGGLRTAAFVACAAVLAAGSRADEILPRRPRQAASAVVMRDVMRPTATNLLAAGPAVPTRVTGDDDAYVETNEVWNLTVPLIGVSDDVTGVSAVLSSSTPGVSITAPSSAYADLIGGNPADNQSPYTFFVGGTVPCGGLIQFTLTVSFTDSTSAPRTELFAFSIQTGQPGVPSIFSYTGPPVAIADAADATGTVPGAIAAVSLPVAGVVGSLFDLDLRIDGAACNVDPGSPTVGVDHTRVSDLRMTLRSPLATDVLAISNIGQPGVNFCQTTLDDESGGDSIQNALDPPFTGSFTPNAPLSAFRGENPNGTWQLRAQDFFSPNTGNVRAFSLIVTPAVCDAPAAIGTMSVSGTFEPGGTVTYAVTLKNTSGTSYGDNPGDEFVDVLPAGLTFVSASASSGLASTAGANTVVWNGAIAPTSSVTIGITATIGLGTAGTVIANQGTMHYDADGNNTNEATTTTDDTTVAGAHDPTSFVVAGGVVEAAAMTVAGTFNEGGTVTYTVIVTNSGTAPATDNDGNEFVAVLPARLALVGASASSGTAVTTVGTNTVTWDGGIGAGGSVTITVTATIKAGGVGTAIASQGAIHYDFDGNHTNETTKFTDDPGLPGANDPTSFIVLGGVAETLTKTVAGAFTVGTTVTYTIAVVNLGSLPAADNPGPEFVDILPSGLTLVGASASRGTVVATIGTNTVAWNGSLAALGGAVTIAIEATINPAPGGTTISNQGTAFTDVDGNGTSETTTTTDDPAVSGAHDPTRFVVKRSYFTVAACRVLDTRSGAPIPAGGTLTVSLTGGACGIPTAATAVSLNVSVTLEQAPGFVTLFPADQPRPNTSAVNFSAGQTRANNGILSLAADGTGRIKALNGSAGTTHLIIDVSGYFE